VSGSFFWSFSPLEKKYVLDRLLSPRMSFNVFFSSLFPFVGLSSCPCPPYASLLVVPFFAIREEGAARLPPLAGVLFSSLCAVMALTLEPTFLPPRQSPRRHRDSFFSPPLLFVPFYNGVFAFGGSVHGSSLRCPCSNVRLPHRFKVAFFHRLLSPPPPPPPPFFRGFHSIFFSFGGFASSNSLPCEKHGFSSRNVLFSVAPAHLSTRRTSLLGVFSLNVPLHHPSTREVSLRFRAPPPF